MPLRQLRIRTHSSGLADQCEQMEGTLVQEQSLGRSTFAELLERGIVLARKNHWVADQRNRPAMIGRQDSSNAELHPKLDDIARYRADPKIQAVVELAALVWRELKCEHERTGLEGLVPVPNDAPLVAVKMTRKQRLEAAEIDFNHPELMNPQHTWYVELEDPGRELPNGIALWKSCHGNRSRSVDGGDLDRRQGRVGKRPIRGHPLFEERRGGIHRTRTGVVPPD